MEKQGWVLSTNLYKDHMLVQAFVQRTSVLASTNSLFKQFAYSVDKSYIFGFSCSNMPTFILPYVKTLNNLYLDIPCDYLKVKPKAGSCRDSRTRSHTLLSIVLLDWSCFHGVEANIGHCLFASPCYGCTWWRLFSSIKMSLSLSFLPFISLVVTSLCFPLYSDVVCPPKSWVFISWSLHLTSLHVNHSATDSVWAGS